MSGKVELLDNATLVNQIAGLERRVGRGRDHIAAAGSGHDDAALAAAGALVRAAKADETFVAPMIYIADEDLSGRHEARLRGYPVAPISSGDHLTGTLEWTALRARGLI
jgi:hypothetical protein